MFVRVADLANQQGIPKLRAFLRCIGREWSASSQDPQMSCILFGNLILCTAHYCAIIFNHLLCILYRLYILLASVWIDCFAVELQSEASDVKELAWRQATWSGWARREDFRALAKRVGRKLPTLAWKLFELWTCLIIYLFLIYFYYSIYIFNRIEICKKKC